MAFGDIFRATTWTGEDVADKLEDLLVSYQHLNSTAAISTTSTSNIDYTSMGTTITASSNDLVFCDFGIVCSNGTAESYVVGLLEVNSTDVQPEVYARDDTGDANGGRDCISGSYAFLGAGGSNTIDLRWRVTGGTGYATRAYLSVLQFRNS